MERLAVASRLLGNLPAAGKPRILAEMIAHLIEFHRRDNKPLWWSFFERANMTEEELYDDIACLSGLILTGIPTQEKRSWIATYRFDPNQETKIRTAASVAMSHCLNVRPTVVSLDSSAGTIELKMSANALSEKLDGEFPAQLSLLPNDFMSAGVI
jgi:uncharacterized protein